jgi:NAD(P)-dependent dehydrogenase (short-subunit alcohol dehydrogenase family)
VTTAKTTLILGATSDIGLAIARAYASAGWHIVLAARDGEAAKRNARDLVVRGAAGADVAALDLRDAPKASMFFDQFAECPDTVICVAGMLGEQKRAEVDAEHAGQIMRTNFEGPALFLAEAANRMAARGTGTIVGISSVAGERGRASNYVYGAAKAGLTAFLSGLRNRLARAGVRVVTVKPGFVRTRMTEGLPLPPVVTAAAAEVGRAVYRAAEIKPRDVVYVRPIWRVIMAVIRALPESIFKRLRL